jgi:repressor LexA
MLTKKQKNLLLYINKKIRSTGISPSYEEMKESLNLKSKSGIHRLISALEERGFVKRLAHKARALEVVKLPENASANDIFNTFTPSVIKGGLDKSPSTAKEISILGSIAAGTPIEAIQQEVDRITLPEDLQNNGEHYGLRVKGNSMIEAGINDGDTVIVKKTTNVESGQIAVVLIDDQEATLKRIRKKGNTIALEAANKNYETKIYAANRIKIQGKLVSLYRNFH